MTEKKKSFLLRHPNLLALCLGCILAASILIAVELGAAYTLRQGGPKAAGYHRAWLFKDKYSPPLTEKNKILGYRLRAKTVCRAEKLRKKISVFSYDVATDAARRRKSVCPEAETRPYCALFFGASFLFGTGVEDHETVASQFGQLAPEYSPYNYGVPGWGPQNTYMLLQEKDFAEAVPQKTGHAFYLYMGDHLNRLIGGMRIRNRWVKQFPCLHLENGQIVYKGNFREGEALKTRIFSLLDKSHFLKLNKFDYPFQYREKDYRLLAKLFKAMEARLQTLFPSIRFHVVTYPNTGDFRPLLLHLIQEEISYFNYDDLYARKHLSWENLRLVDGHPNAESHRLVAQELVADLFDRPQKP